MGLPYCPACGTFHFQTSAGCPTEGPHQSVFNSPGSEWKAPPGVVVDTGVIHRAPLLRRIEELKAALDAETKAHAATQAKASLDWAALEDMGVYCQGYYVKGEFVPRTPWQDGWNAYGSALLKKMSTLEEWWKSLAPSVAELLAPLIASEEDDALLWLREHEGNVTAWLNMGDTFAYACADAEEVPLDEASLSAVGALWRDHGASGLTAWAALRRGAEPIEPLRGVKYEAAMEAARALAAPLLAS